MAEAIKVSSTSLLARAQECIRNREKPFVFKCDRGESQPLWCIDWGKGQIQVIIRFEYAAMVLDTLYRKLNVD